MDLWSEAEKMARDFAKNRALQAKAEKTKQEKQQASYRALKKKFDVAVEQFLDAMQKAGNPGMTITDKKGIFKQNIQGFWYWNSGKQSNLLENHYIKINSNGTWELGETYQGEGPWPRDCTSETLKILQVGLVTILKENHVSLPRG